MTSLYLGSGEENIDGVAVKAAESVDGGFVNAAIDDRFNSSHHNPDADEVGDAAGERGGG